MNNGNPAVWFIMFCIIALVLTMVGFFIFPSLNTVIQGIDTTGWNKITAGIHSLFPFAFIGGIFFTLIWMWAKRHG